MFSYFEECDNGRLNSFNYDVFVSFTSVAESTKLISEENFLCKFNLPVSSMSKVLGENCYEVL